MTRQSGREGTKAFPLDVGFFADARTASVTAQCGPCAPSVILRVICQIVSEGEFSILDTRIIYLIATQCGVTDKDVQVVIQRSAEQGILDKRKLDGDNMAAMPDKPRRGHKPAPATPAARSLNSRAREMFEAFFAALFADDYYWTAKDSGAMSALLKKLAYQRERKGMPTDDDSLLVALDAFLRSVEDQWVMSNYSVTIINSKFNELRAQAQRRYEQHKDTIKDKRDFLRNVAEGIARARNNRQRREGSSQPL